MSKGIKKSIRMLFSVYLPLALILLFVLFPIYWIINMSLKTDAEILSRTTTYFPPNPTFQNYSSAWGKMGFARFFKNSLIVSSLASVAIVSISILTGYTLARFRFKGKGAFMLLLLSTQFFPGSMLLMPLFDIFKNLNLLNKTPALIITYTVFQMSFNSILMRGFISAIPYELEEAAKIDGCKAIQTIWHVLIPLLLPGIVAGFSFAFVNSWKEFLYAFLIYNTGSKHTISVGLHYMMGEFTLDFGYLAAGGVIAMLPPLLIFIYLQKYLVSGLSAGAVKG